MALPGTAAAQEDCHQAPQSPSKLCEQHCIKTAQSVDTQPHGAPAAPLLGVIRVEAACESLIPATREASHPLAAHAAGPPPLVRYGVLRI
jgi:hypothetical protein